MREEENYSKGIIKNSYFLIIVSIISIVVGYTLRIFLSKTLSIEDFGLFYAISAFLGLFALIRHLGLNQAIVKYIPEFLVDREYRKIKSIIAISFISQLIIVSLFIFVVFTFSNEISMIIFKTEGAAIILQIMSLSFLPSIFFSLFQSVFQGFQKIKMYALVEFTRISLTLIFAFILVVNGLGLFGLSMSYLIAAIITSIIFSIFFLKIPNILSGSLDASKLFIKKIYKFSLPVFIGSLAAVIVSNIDTFILTISRSFEEVGLYQIALPTSQLLLVFVSAITVVLFPLTSKLYKKNEIENLASTVKLLVVFLFLTIIPFVVFLVVFPEVVINILFSEKYIGATQTIQILSISSIFYSIFLIFQTTLDGIGKQVMSMKNIYIVAAVNLLLNITFIPTYGIIGAAITTNIAFALGMGISFYGLNKTISLRLPIIKLLKIFVGSILMIVFMLYMKSILNIYGFWINIPLTVIFGVCFYFIYISLTKSLIKQDLNVLTKFGIPKRLLSFLERFLLK